MKVDNFIHFMNSKVGITYHTKLKKLATVVEGDQKAPFSIATTPRCRGGRYFFP